MRTVPEYVIEERLPAVNLPLMEHEPAYPANFGVALRMFEALVRTDPELYGPHTGNRLVLRQTGVWVRPPLCRNCGEAIWRDGIAPDVGIWLHRHRYDKTAARMGTWSWPARLCRDGRSTAQPFEFALGGAR